MKIRLTKLSSPGWEKDFDSEEEARDALFPYICKMCRKGDEMVEFGWDPNPLDEKSSIEDMLCSPCGCEFDIDEIPEKDSDGNYQKFLRGERVFVKPLKIPATVIRQMASYDGPDYWFWGNVELRYDDGAHGISNSWQLEKYNENDYSGE